MRSAGHLLRADPRARALLAGAIACGVTQLVLTLGALIALAVVVSDVFLGGADLAATAPVLLGVAVAFLVRGGCILLAEVLAARASALVRMRVRDDLAVAVVAAGPGGLAGERVGDVASVLGEGVEALDAYVTRYLPALGVAAVGPLVVAATVAVLDPWTTLVLLFAGPMLVLILAVIGMQTRDLTRRRLDELGWLNSFSLDLIRGLATLKAFNRTPAGAEALEAMSRRFGSSSMDVLRTAFQTSLVMEWAAVAATALVAVEVSFRLIAGDLTFERALAVLVITPEFFLPLRRLSADYHAGQTGQAALRRIDHLTGLVGGPGEGSGWDRGGGARTAAASSAGSTPASPPTGSPTTPPAAPLLAAPATAPTIELVGVSARYPGSDADAVRDVDLRIEAGRTVALVGPSGAGKTTLARLLLRFLDPVAGVILVDGRPLVDLDAGAWRRRVAWVPQDPQLLGGTLAEVIRLGDPGASMVRVRRAADLARATEFVERLPAGFDTALGERGLRLSGGQRQRLAIARAALRDAPVVLLDEYTAHLDPEVEAEIAAAMQDLLRDRTALVISHRPASTVGADLVVRIDGGRVAALGGARSGS